MVLIPKSSRLSNTPSFKSPFSNWCFFYYLYKLFMQMKICNNLIKCNYLRWVNKDLNLHKDIIVFQTETYNWDDIWLSIDDDKNSKIFKSTETLHQTLKFITKTWIPCTKNNITHDITGAPLKVPPKGAPLVFRSFRYVFLGLPENTK